VKEIWHNQIEEDAFRETQCRRCFQRDEAILRTTGAGEGCPHLLRASQNKMPTAWTPRRNAVMGEKYRCADRLAKPPVVRRGKAVDETPAMLEVEEVDRFLVPVDGWPDYRAEERKVKEGEHQ
jgi:hypothetical protein